MSDTRPRLPRGLPAGGQFATATKPEPEVTLGASSQGPAESTLRSIEDFEAGLRADATVLTEAAKALEGTLVPIRAESLRRARIDAENSPRIAASNRLHAELVDAVTDSPSRDEVDVLRVRSAAANSAAADEAVARDLGLATDESVASAKSVAVLALNELRVAERERYKATRKRIQQGNPTVYDMRETQERATSARNERRAAVNAADAAREVYASTAADSPELHRRSLAVDEATRREGQAEDSYNLARRELTDAQASWSRHFQG